MSFRVASLMWHFRALAKVVSPLVLFGVLAFLENGCSNFNHEWRKAVASPVPIDNIQGAWQGQWISDANGHNGELRCIVAKTNDETYLARFHAKYATIFSFGYTVPVKVERSPAAFQFSGEANLGPFAGGVYRYDGHADATNFFSNYSSKYDHGTFQMKRP